MLTNLSNMPIKETGRSPPISGSRPTMMVSLWCRAWLQRQTTDSRQTMNDAIS